MFKIKKRCGAYPTQKDHKLNKHETTAFGDSLTLMSTFLVQWFLRGSFFKDYPSHVLI